MSYPLAVGIVLASLLARADDPPKPKLSMNPGVVCVKITGYGDFTPMDEPTLTRDDKMLIYYEPLGYSYETVGKEYRIHLIQDGRIHKRGEKAAIQTKEKLVEYNGRSKTPPYNNVYLSNSIALKSLPPGEYDFEIILHDELAKGPAASQLVKFRVKAADPPPEKP